MAARWPQGPRPRDRRSCNRTLGQRAAWRVWRHRNVTALSCSGLPWAVTSHRWGRTLGRVLPNMIGQHRLELVGQADHALADILGRPDRDLAPIPLELPGDRELAPEDVDIAHLDAGRLPHPQPGERAQCPLWQAVTSWPGVPGAWAGWMPEAPSSSRNHAGSRQPAVQAPSACGVL